MENLNQSSVTSPQPVQANSSNFPKLIVSSLIIIAIFVAGYFVFAKYRSWWPFGNVTIQNQAPSVTHTTETADWKIYQDKDYGFEFRYPQERLDFAENKSGQYLNISLSEKKDQQIFSMNFEVNYGPRGYEGGRPESSKIKIDGQDVTKTIYFDADPQNPELISFTLDFQKNGNDFLFSGITYQEHLKFLDQILSTFKFTNNFQAQVTNLKGWLLIYDPSTTASELHNKGFKPLTWYLIPKDTTWPGSPSTTIELIINNNSICLKPKDQFSDAIEFNCKELKVKWGYGDRVRIWGSKSNNIVTVSRMEIVSSLLVEQW